MLVLISGKEKTVKAENVAELVKELKINPENMAVVKNGKIISKNVWEMETVKKNDSIDFFSPVSGG